MTESELTDALGSLRREYPPMPRAGGIEARVLESFDDRHAGGRRWTAAVGLAAAAGLACFGLLSDVRDRSEARPLEVSTAFLAIPYTVAPAPYERTTVVRMKIPVTALIAAGFEVFSTDTSATISADVLLGQDDRAVAIRPVGVNNSERRTEDEK